jgi:heat shock protein HslJ
MKSKILATMVVVILGAWLLPGCKLFTQDVSLPGTYWTLVALNSHELLPDSAISVAFKTSEMIPIYLFGRMGCNDYSSPVELDKEHSRAIHIISVWSTSSRLCAPNLLEQEREYLEALRSTQAYAVAGERLRMKDQDGNVVLEFQRSAIIEDVTLKGTHWSLERLDGHKLVAESYISLIFEEGESLLSGKAGCNQYFVATELINGQIIRVGVGAGGMITNLLCLEPEGVMEQEKEYLTTLRSAMTYEVSDSQLELKNQAGEVVLVFRSSE